jgi:hypothetical protein
MNQKKITATSKQTQLIAVAIIAASAVAAAMIIGINNSQNLQKAMAQEVYPSANGTAAKEEANEYKNTATVVNSSTGTTAASVKTVSPNQSTKKNSG